MNLEERVSRRWQRESEPRLVQDLEAINPVAHLDEPTDRGASLEQVLDHLDPTFHGEVPPDLYLWGPKGSGKSAVTTALFEHLSSISHRSRSVIYTSTRAVEPETVEFVYIDARTAGSDFGIYHEVLDALIEETVPEHGVGTAEIRRRLQRELQQLGPAVIAVDHLGEPSTPTYSHVRELFDDVDAAVSMVGIGRDAPDDAAGLPDSTVELEAYPEHTLVDVVTGRTSNGLARHAINHEQVRRVAEWAEGDAHDALAALFGAADIASREAHDQITAEDLSAGMDLVSKPCVALGEVLALPYNRQKVLRLLVDLDPEQRESVQATTEAIVNADDVSLSPATVKRVLYELADAGIIRRVQVEKVEGVGRPPSRVEPRFPTLVFQRLFPSGP